MKLSLHDHTEDRTPEEVRESAYRRGFEQGALAAMRLAYKSDNSPAIPTRWVDRIHLWRNRRGLYESPRQIITWPPEINGDTIALDQRKMKPAIELKEGTP